MVVFPSARLCGFATCAVNSRRFSPNQENGFQVQGCGPGAWAPWTTRTWEVRPCGIGSCSAQGLKPHPPTPTQVYKTGRSRPLVSLLSKERTSCLGPAPKVNHPGKSKTLFNNTCIFIRTKNSCNVVYVNYNEPWDLFLFFVWFIGCAV